MFAIDAGTLFAGIRPDVIQLCPQRVQTCVQQIYSRHMKEILVPIGSGMLLC